MKYPDLEGASCDGLDTELFFPVTTKEEYETRPMLELMCADCTVYKKCFNYALNVQVEGYWAGTDKKDRESLRREFGIVAESLSNDIRTLFGSDTASAIKRRKGKTA